jgi:hypothetical protein
MSCNQYREAIAEFVDGELDLARRRALEQHVEGCARCRALVADLKSIQAAAFTLDRHPLPPTAWNAIRARIAAAPRPSERGRLLQWPRTAKAWRVWTAAAAGLLNPIATVQAEFQAAEEHYDKAIQGLEQIARTQSGDLDPQVAAVLQKNLQVIDQAIGESRAALQMQPSSADAQDSLFDAMRTKVAVLQQTVELINEMRKGNQAEAGRLIQGLNQ